MALVVEAPTRGLPSVLSSTMPGRSEFIARENRAKIQVLCKDGKAVRGGIVHYFDIRRIDRAHLGSVYGFKAKFMSIRIRSPRGPWEPSAQSGIGASRTESRNAKDLPGPN